MESQELQNKTQSLVTNVPLAILVAAAMVSGSILYTSSGGGTAALNDEIPLAQESKAPEAIKNPNDLFSKADAVLGSEDAKVTIVEFSDFQCPFCRSFFSGAYAQIKKEYIDTGKARLVFRHYPLAFHSAARPSAIAAECAGEQGKFWQFHDKIFNEQALKGTGTIAYGVTELKAWAAQIGVDAPKFNSCLDSEKYASKVEKDTADGAKYGVSGTPTLFVNGKIIVGAQPFAQFKALIDAEL
jgi:protein-disulfide isomerase